MQLPQEIINSRQLDAYTDTDAELLFAVKNYNEKMALAQRFKRRLRLLENVFLAANIGILIIFGMIPTGVVFLINNPRIIWFENACAIVFIVAFIIFGLWKRVPVAVTAASALLIFSDARYFMLVGMNIVFTVFILKNRAVMRAMDGYPNFYRIHVEKHSGKKTNNSEKDIDKSEEK